LEILEYCDGSTREDLIKREQYYIDLLKPEYNILQKAGSSLGFKHSEETLTKMSTAQVGAKNTIFGKKHSEETRAKMSSSRAGEKNPMTITLFGVNKII